jgi:tRNA (cmo5U34)-methyltransferase
MSGSTREPFDDPEVVARYAEGPPRLVPGFAALQRMALILLRERAPQNARVLVHGAGCGLELKVFAEAEPDWRFVGVDTSAEMLKLAREVIGKHASRTVLHHGTIDTAPRERFDAATSLLTLHFLDAGERRRTLSEIHKRLRPGAPLVVAHLSIPGTSENRGLWLKRYAAFAIDNGIAPENAKNAAAAIAEKLPILTPQQDEGILRHAGFEGVSLFYAGFTFHGWVAYA